jgi:hypothetical protein
MLLVAGARGDDDFVSLAPLVAMLLVASARGDDDFAPLAPLVAMLLVSRSCTARYTGDVKIPWPGT